MGKSDGWMIISSIRKVKLSVCCGIRGKIKSDQNRRCFQLLNQTSSKVQSRENSYSWVCPLKNTSNLLINTSFCVEKLNCTEHFRLSANLCFIFGMSFPEYFNPNVSACVPERFGNEILLSCIIHFYNDFPAKGIDSLSPQGFAK